MIRKLAFLAVCLVLFGLLAGCSHLEQPETERRTQVPLPTVPPEQSQQEQQTPKLHEAAAGFEGGRGTWGDPYRIADAAQLALMARLVTADAAYADAYYELTCSISLNDTADFDNWSEQPPAYEWEPIGRLGNKFSGVFDGKGYTVSGMYIHTDAYLSGDYYQQNYGLFAEVIGTVRNLSVEQAYIRVEGASNLGAVAGHLSDGRGRIENCRVDALIKCNSGSCGGVVGNVFAGTVTGCSFDGKIQAGGEEDYTNAGGIVGTTRRAAVRGCMNRGAVSDADTAGGIVGWHRSGTVSGCTNEGTVSGKHTGGIAGRVADEYDSRGAYIRSCQDLASETGG